MQEQDCYHRMVEYTRYSNTHSMASLQITRQPEKASTRMSNRPGLDVVKGN